MASPQSQCCSNPPMGNPKCGEGAVVDDFGGLKAYISPNSNPTAAAAILLVSDVFGFEAPKLRKLADKVAAAGYCVVVPDFLFGDPYDPKNTERPISVWIKDHSADKGYADAKKVVLELKKNHGISVVAAAGFCWGAKVVTELAKSGDIQSAVLLHPSLVTVDDIREVKCPISVLAAEIDHISPPALIKQFEVILSSKPDVRHGS